MQHDHINTINLNHYPKEIQKILQYIKENNVKDLEVGKHDIVKDKIWMLVQEVLTCPDEEKYPESHRIYTDIHYLITGIERIYYTHSSNGSSIKEDMLEEKDLAFHNQSTKNSSILLTEGMFLILKPGEIHKPCCMDKEPMNIKKIVVKIHKDCLD